MNEITSFFTHEPLLIDPHGQHFIDHCLSARKRQVMPSNMMIGGASKKFVAVADRNS